MEQHSDLWTCDTFGADPEGPCPTSNMRGLSEWALVRDGAGAKRGIKGALKCVCFTALIKEA